MGKIGGALGGEENHGEGKIGKERRTVGQRGE